MYHCATSMMGTAKGWFARSDNRPGNRRREAMNNQTTSVTRQILGALMIWSALTVALDAAANEPSTWSGTKASGLARCPAAPCASEDILDDPVNVIHRATIGGRPSSYPRRPLPPSAFSRDTSLPRPKPDAVEPGPLPRLHPRLAAIMKSDPSAQVAVIVQLR